MEFRVDVIFILLTLATHVSASKTATLGKGKYNGNFAALNFLSKFFQTPRFILTVIFKTV
jgi:hypothetical protein